jgi:hypothetical protein
MGKVVLLPQFDCEVLSCVQPSIWVKMKGSCVIVQLSCVAATCGKGLPVCQGPCSPGRIAPPGSLDMVAQQQWLHVCALEDAGSCARLPQGNYTVWGQKFCRLACLVDDLTCLCSEAAQTVKAAENCVLP